MNNLNSVLLEGTCVSKPVVEAVADSQKALCSFVVESVRNERGGDKEVSSFEIETYGRLAGVVGQTITEGRGLRIVGRMKQIRWKDEAGEEQTAIRVIAEHIEVKPGKA
ncbi:Single-stranded DNA-binding protein (fragment) [uncultured Spirochaetota bacterium]|uniref:Single-stranded DNA-binding protein n=1 Tax=uncultured Spirochaetota bacterium TaxID=460511 RepID=A0A652ZVV8_9SPIR